MKLYAGTTEQFRADARMHRIAEKLRAEYTTQIGHRPAPSEVASWQNSLMALSPSALPVGEQMNPRLFTVRKGVNLYKGPGFNYPLHWTLPHQQRFRVVGWALDPRTKTPTNWVLASRAHGGGLFLVPPVH
jgi:hypothetical protein